jgi:Zn-dependent protease
MILIHELGHAVLVRRARAEVVEITLHVMGGECWWRGQVTPLQRAAIAFGGVWAQLVLAAAAFGFASLAPAEMMTGRMTELVDMWTRWNLFNAAFNLIPIKPLDGSEAWKLFPLLWRRLRFGRLERQQSRNRRELKQIESELQALLKRARKSTGDKPTDDKSSLS